MGRFGVDPYGVEEYGKTSSSGDTLGPLLIPINPAAGEIGVIIGSNIQLNLIDDTGLNLDTIQVEIDTGAGYTTAFKYSESPQFKSGWDGVGSATSGTVNDFSITIDPVNDLPPYQIVQVRVLAYDTLGYPVRLS